MAWVQCPTHAHTSMYGMMYETFSTVCNQTDWRTWAHTQQTTFEWNGKTSKTHSKDCHAAGYEPSLFVRVWFLFFFYYLLAVHSRVDYGLHDRCSSLWNYSHLVASHFSASRFDYVRFFPSSVRIALPTTLGLVWPKFKNIPTRGITWWI